jgi:hypothetical protein
MPIIARSFAILAGFLGACVAADLIVVVAALYPDWSDIHLGPMDRVEFGAIAALAFVFVSALAFVPALVAVVVAETWSFRSILYYAIAGAVVGFVGYAGLVNFDLDRIGATSYFRREMEIMIGAGIVGGLVYWLIAGRNAGVWRRPPATGLAPRGDQA